MLGYGSSFVRYGSGRHRLKWLQNTGNGLFLSEREHALSN